MELPLAATAQCDLRAVIRFLNEKGVKPIENHRQLTEVYGETCMDVNNVRKWCRKFTAGRLKIHNKERSGRRSISNKTVVIIISKIVSQVEKKRSERNGRMLLQRHSGKLV